MVAWMKRLLCRMFHRSKKADGIQVKITCDTSELKKQMADLRAELKLIEEIRAPAVVKCGRHSTLFVRYRGELSDEARDRLETICRKHTGMNCFAVPDSIDLSVLSR